MLGKDRNGRADVARVAAVALLLMIAAVGMRARAGLSAKPPGWAAASSRAFDATAGLMVALAATACLVLVVFVFRGGRRKRPEDEWAKEPPPRSRAARAVALLFALAVVSPPIVLLVTHPDARRNAERPRPVPPVGGTPRSATHPPAHTVTAHTSVLPGISVGMAAAAAAVMLALALRANRRRRGELPLERPNHAPSAAPLRAALAEAAGALRDPADPRHAIIASYAAMEARLADAGAAAAAADTPAEVLARAAAAGLVLSPAAGTLTRLFRRARYSRHRIPESDREAAAAALARLRADLEQAP